MLNQNITSFLNYSGEFVILYINMYAMQILGKV